MSNESSVANDALHVIEEIVSPPKLSPEEWAVVEVATPYIQATMKPTLLLELEQKYIAREVSFRDELTAITRAGVEESMAQWRKEQEPMAPEDISKLLGQKYEEFAFSITTRGKDSKTFDFIIGEASQEVELRFIDVAKRKLIPLLEEINASELTLDGTVIEQIRTLLHKLPAALDAANELVAICLDPWEENEAITAKWVKRNLSITRQENILAAQAEANRYRDFFLKGSQLYRSLMKK